MTVLPGRANRNRSSQLVKRRFRPRYVSCAARQSCVTGRASSSALLRFHERQSLYSLTAWDDSFVCRFAPLQRIVLPGHFPNNA
eukprot:6200918-Pleurochrysis_carterae.AAC.3